MGQAFTGGVLTTEDGGIFTTEGTEKGRARDCNGRGAVEFTAKITKLKREERKRGGMERRSVGTRRVKIEREGQCGSGGMEM
jgi:hypothetical protein